MEHLVSSIVATARGHPDLAYALTFVLAMFEAFPVVGAFVPGTAVILAISAMIPAGAVAVWPMVATATLGAVCGDGFSYWLGHHYYNAITERWPLRSHPGLIARGEAFIARHGGKSIFVARFTPGVRAIVPMLAGVLRMSPTRFYAMNVLSALAWDPSHVLVGALIGASLVLLGAVTGRLAVFAVVLILLLWGTAYLVRHAVRRLPALASVAQERLSDWACTRDTWLGRALLSLLDPNRKELPGLVLLGAMLAGGLWVFLGVLEDVITGDPLVRADHAMFQFLQSLRTSWADQLMVAVTELGDGTVTIAVTMVELAWFAWRQAWWAVAYLVAAVAVAGLFTLVMKAALHLTRPEAVASGWGVFSFPSGHAAVNAALYGFLAILAAWEASASRRLVIAIAATFFVAAIAFSRLYLGAHWISDVLAGVAFGVSWAALLGIAYFRRDPPILGAGRLCLVAVATVVVAGSAHVYRWHSADLARYAVREVVRTMSVSAWQRHGWSELPARRVDLLGEFEEPFTVQWAGSLKALQQQLVASGWGAPASWTTRSVLAWLQPGVRLKDLPVLPRLENGHQEELVLVHPARTGGPETRYVLRLWQSRVSLRHGADGLEPLWIGTVVAERVERVPPLLTTVEELPDRNMPIQILAGSMTSTRSVERDVNGRHGRWDGTVLLGRASWARSSGQ